MPEKDGNKVRIAEGFDFPALEIEIDQEIDSLFAPAAQRPAPEAGAAAGPGTPESVLEPSALELNPNSS